MKSFWQILRLRNLGFLALTLLGIAILCAPLMKEEMFKLSYFWVALFFIYAICSVTASGYVINDLFDIETDKINKPEKQILGKDITISQSKKIYIALLLVGLFIGAIFQWASQIMDFLPIIFISQLTLFIYAKYLKRSLIWGNLLVAFMTALPYLIFAYIFDVKDKFFIVLLLLALFAFLLNFIREIAKDWEDIAGDKVIQARTIPIMFGVKNTQLSIKLLFVVSLTVHVVAPFLLFQKYIKELDQIFILIWPIYAVALMHLYFFWSAWQKENWSPKKMSRYLKMMMLVGVIWVYYLILVI